MKWYAAHLVLFVKFKEARQERYPIWENIVLVKAKSEEEAFRKAEQRGHDDEGDDDGSFRWGGKPASWVFAGVRKLTSCEDPAERPCDGTEVTYLEMEAATKRDVDKFVSGEAVSLRFSEEFRGAVNREAHSVDAPTEIKIDGRVATKVDGRKG